MVNFLFTMVEIPFPYLSSQSPKTQIVDMFCFSVLMFTSLHISVRLVI